MPEKYILRLILLEKLSIFGQLSDLDIPELGALVTGSTFALNYLTHLQTVGKDIE